jgi:selenoprotein W-related protein
LAAELKEKKGIDAELIESSGGVFEVQYEGTLIFSKKKLDRFPEDGEILNLIEQTCPKGDTAVASKN